MLKLFKVFLAVCLISIFSYISFMGYFTFSKALPAIKTEKITLSDFFKSDISPEKKEALIRKAGEKGAEMGREIGEQLFSAFHSK